VTIKRRISKLEDKIGLKKHSQILIMIQNQDFEGDHDLEAEIQKKLKEKRYKSDECKVLVVRFVAAKHNKNSHDS